MPIFALLLAVTTWGWSFVATKILLEHLTPLQVIACRLMLGWPPLLAMVLLRRRKLSFSVREWGRISLCGTIVAVHFLIQVAGLQYTSATHTGWLIAVIPLAIALLSIVFLGERLSPLQMSGILIATSGVLLLIGGGNLSNLGWLENRGDWLAFTSAWTWAIYTVMSRSIAQARSPLGVSTAALGVTTVLSLAVLWGSGQMESLGAALSSLSGLGWAALLFLAWACLSLAFWLWQYGVAQLGASRAGLFLYLEPPATTLLAVPYLGEPFGWPTAVGGLLILSGVFLGSRGQPSPRQDATLLKTRP